MAVMIYGATGYTGSLVAEAAHARGVPMIMAGRSADALARMAGRLGARTRTFSLDAPALQGVTALVNCAGPFAMTGVPLARACIAAGVHYLDLAGEVAEHEAIRALDREARAKGVMLLPGVGFGVVPTECAAVLAHRALPTAHKLTIAYETQGGASRGTLETVLGGLAAPGVVRRAGELVAEAPATRVIQLEIEAGVRVTVASNPFRADLVSAYESTHIPEIETYATFPAVLRVLMRSRVRRWKTVQRLIAWLVARAPSGPDAKARAQGRTRILAIAEENERRVIVRVAGPEAYVFTARAAAVIASRIGEAVPGYRTPSQVFGPELLEQLLDPSAQERIEVIA